MRTQLLAFGLVALLFAITLAMPTPQRLAGKAFSVMGEVTEEGGGAAKTESVRGRNFCRPPARIWRATAPSSYRSEAALGRRRHSFPRRCLLDGRSEHAL